MLYIDWVQGQSGPGQDLTSLGPKAGSALALNLHTEAVAVVTKQLNNKSTETGDCPAAVQKPDPLVYAKILSCRCCANIFWCWYRPESAVISSSLMRFCYNALTPLGSVSPSHLPSLLTELVMAGAARFVYLLDPIAGTTDFTPACARKRAELDSAARRSDTGVLLMW